MRSNRDRDLQFTVLESQDSGLDKQYPRHWLRLNVRPVGRLLAAVNKLSIFFQKDNFKDISNSDKTVI